MSKRKELHCGGKAVQRFFVLLWAIFLLFALAACATTETPLPPTADGNTTQTNVPDVTDEDSDTSTGKPEDDGTDNKKEDGEQAEGGEEIKSSVMAGEWCGWYADEYLLVAFYARIDKQGKLENGSHCVWQTFGMDVTGQWEPIALTGQAPDADSVTLCATAGGKEVMFAYDNGALAAKADDGYGETLTVPLFAGTEDAFPTFWNDFMGTYAAQTEAYHCVLAFSYSNAQYYYDTEIADFGGERLEVDTVTVVGYGVTLRYLDDAFALTFDPVQKTLTFVDETFFIPARTVLRKQWA